MANIEQQTYSALRHGGASQARACAELGVNSGRGGELERGFRRWEGGGSGDPMRPRYAHDRRHVAAALAGGGFPVIR